MVEEGSKPRRKSNVILFRRIAAVAASLVLVFSLSITANAFSFKDVWDAVVTWAQETFSFSMGVEVSEPASSDNMSYNSFEDALAKAKHYISVPQWIPDRFELVDVIVEQTPVQETFLAVYECENQYLKISVKSFLISKPEQIEVNPVSYEIYSVSGIDYYIFSNNHQNKASWITDTYECYISGDLNTEEIKLMIDSITRG